MDAHRRTHIRAGVILHEQLARRRATLGDVYLPTHSWRCAEDLLRRRDLARRRGWYLAAASLAGDLAWELGYLGPQLKHCLEVLEGSATQPSRPSPTELCQEIAALEREFSEVRVDLKHCQLVVVSEPIVLGNHELGSFEIRLNLMELGEFPSYCVVALKPNSPEHNSRVTHPHVQDDRLCEGEGHQAIQLALTEGRLMDFFLIVARLLATYNVGQAYVELDQWDGVPCADCDGTIPSDEIRQCSACDSQLCEECREFCSHCTTVYCRGCMAECSDCGQLHCDACLDHCSKCQQPLCANCMENSLCSSCQPQSPLPPRKEDDAQITESVPRSQHACVAAH